MLTKSPSSHQMDSVLVKLVIFGWTVLIVLLSVMKEMYILLTMETRELLYSYPYCKDMLYRLLLCNSFYFIYNFVNLKFNLNLNC